MSDIRSLLEPGVLDDPECTGGGTCHGCLNWCVDCGDVDLTCDDPECSIHPRLEEVEFSWGCLREKWDEVRKLLERAKKDMDGARRTVDEYRRGPYRMCPRGKRTDIVRHVLES